MNYQVIVTEPAEQDIDSNVYWWSKNRSAAQSLRWYDGILLTIDSLEEQPQRCPLVHEDEQFSEEIRELHYGIGSRPTHRIIFTIHSEVVLVLAVRHAAQADLTAADLPQLQ